MDRRQALQSIAGGALLAGTVPRGGAVPVQASLNGGMPLRPPADGPLNVAFVIGPQTVLIDVAGPWEAFSDAMKPIRLYLVRPPGIRADLGGIAVEPEFTFEDAPMPHVLVVPATKQLPETIAWIKTVNPHTDVTMSVCTGAFLLAKAGLLDGLYATTHHEACALLGKWYPKVRVICGKRYVENAHISTSGGETSGIELALRVVERYFGRAAAASSADNMEYVPTADPFS